MTRWGIAGCGFIAGRRADVLKGRRDARLTAVAARELTRAQDFAQKWGVPRSYGSYRELARDPRVDAVYIATIHPAHAEIARLFLEADKAVLCEKPLAMSEREAHGMLELAAQKRCLLMEGMWTVFLPAWQELRERLRGGELGDIRAMTADFSDVTPYDPHLRIFDPAKGGGALLDLGVYCLHTAFYLLGTEYRSLSVGGRSAPSGVDSFASLTLAYPDGAEAYLTCASDMVGTRDARIMGTKGWAQVPSFFGATELTLHVGEGKVQCRFAQIDGFHYEVEEFHRLLSEGKDHSDVVPPETTLAVQRVMDQAMKMIVSRK